MAILLWFISLGIFGIIFISPSLNLKDLTTVSIFPILFMILLVENFIEVQAGRSMKEAIGMTLETILIAVGCFLLMSWRWLQSFVLLNPEISVVGILLLNIFVGRYTGFRLLEYKRFQAVFKR
jgi:hypothetical protein